jgi:hypothetical protein
MTSQQVMAPNLQKKLGMEGLTATWTEGLLGRHKDDHLSKTGFYGNNLLSGAIWIEDDG